MTALGAEEIRTRVESDFNRIVDVLNQKIALQSISAKGITADYGAMGIRANALRIHRHL